MLGTGHGQSQDQRPRFPFWKGIFHLVVSGDVTMPFAEAQLWAYNNMFQHMQLPPHIILSHRMSKNDVKERVVQAKEDGKGNMGKAYYTLIKPLQGLEMMHVSGLVESADEPLSMKAVYVSVALCMLLISSEDIHLLCKCKIIPTDCIMQLDAWGLLAETPQWL